jgi:PST family polysaccharide transporter
VNDFGLTAALIQRDQSKISASFINTTFSASLIVASCLCVLSLTVVAPLAADFYDVPVLHSMISVIALSFLLSPFSSVASALALRERRFREVALVRVAANIFALGGALLLLLLDPSPWVLVVQSLLVTVGMSVGLIWLSRWRYRLLLERGCLKDIFGFSSFVLANDMLVAFSANAGTFVLGRVMSAADVGLFGLATFVTDVVRRSLMSILNRVAFVHYSAMQSDYLALRRAYIKTVTWNCRLVFPVMMTMILVGPNLLEQFLGREWTNMGEVVRWLSVSVMIHAAGGATSTLYKAIGRPGLDMGLFGATTLLILFPSMIFGALTHGLTGVAVAVAATKAISILVRQILVDRLIGETGTKILYSVTRLLILQIPLLAFWAIGRWLYPETPWMLDILLMAAGILAFGALEVRHAFPTIIERISARLKAVK